MGNNDDGLCCCCVGLAIGYLIWGGNAHGAELPKNQGNLEKSAITETSNGAIPQRDNFVLRQISRYQEEIGPKMKAAMGREDICRYEPSCSEYARQAVEAHGQVRGSLMAIGRLARCNPLSDGGYDPVKV